MTLMIFALENIDRSVNEKKFCYTVQPKLLQYQIIYVMRINAITYIYIFIQVYIHVCM